MGWTWKKAREAFSQTDLKKVNTDFIIVETTLNFLTLSYRGLKRRRKGRTESNWERLWVNKTQIWLKTNTWGQFSLCIPVSTIVEYWWNVVWIPRMEGLLSRGQRERWAWEIWITGRDLKWFLPSDSQNISIVRYIYIVALFCQNSIYKWRTIKESTLE